MHDREARPKLVHVLVERWARRTPEAVAVATDRTRLTYRELNARANDLARALREVGVGTETTVAVTLDRSPELVIALLAILKAGGAYVPLDPAYPEERRAFMLDDAGATVVIGGSELPEELRASRTALGVPGCPGAFDRPDLDLELPPSSLAYIVYTSGSTGVPKGVGVDHEAVVDLVEDDRRIHVAPGESVMQFAPVAFDASTFELWSTLGRGGRLVVPPPHQLSIEELGRELRRWRPDWFFITCGMFHLMVDHDVDALGAVGTVITGGDVLSPHHVRRAAALPDTTVYASYGPTEATTFASFHLARADAASERVPIGTAFERMRLHVLDEDWREVREGEPGELYLGGAGIARGYHRRPGLTADRFVPDPFSPQPGARLYRTGDVCRALPGGELEFLGRVDRQVKVRGFRVELGEIEAVMVRHDAIAAVAVAALDSGSGMKRLVAYVSPPPGREIEVPELRAWLSDRMPNYMIPTTFVVLDKLPLNPSNKIDRRALPYPWGRRPDADLPPYEPPRTELERVLATVWADSLGLDRVGMWDDYFELGGDSLGSVALLARLNELGITLRARDFFEWHTIAAILQLVGERKPEPAGLAPGLQEAGE